MKIRFATIEDVDAIARINYTSWQEIYRGIVEDNFLNSLKEEQYKAKWSSFFSDANPAKFLLVAENKEKVIAGYCCAGKVRKSFHQCEAEIYALYLSKQYHRKGIGKALFMRSIEEFADRGLKSCCLFVLRDNPSANFYRSFKPDIEELTTAKLGGKDYAEVVLGWCDFKMFNPGSI